MVIYRRTERAAGFTRVTEVTESGAYEQRAVWPDGMVTSHYTGTIQEMGWPSVKQFIKSRPGFIRVDE